MAKVNIIFMTPQSELHVIDARELIEDATAGLRLSAPPLTPRPCDGSRLVFVTEPHGLAVEQYKLLRRRLCALSPRGGIMLVTSPGAAEGKTLTSVNLAWCLAEDGHPTCLVDLDFRAPGVMVTLGSKVESDGVTEVLAGKSTISQVIRQVGARPFYVLGIKERLPSPARQLSSTALKPLLEDLKDTFEWVILDVAPSIPMSDVAEVLPHVDGALMVVRSGKTAKNLIGPTTELLGPKLWGVVLNEALINGSAYYGYYGNDKGRRRD